MDMRWLRYIHLCTCELTSDFVYFFQEARRYVLENEEFQTDFTVVVRHSFQNAPLDMVLYIIYKELTRRIINVYMNSIVNIH